jgi:putative tryptophan/tyrosine transport system substrate-binding protein
MMDRRTLVAGLGCVTAWPRLAHAQQAAKVWRVGSAGVQARASPSWVAFEQRLAELGYREGTNFVFDYVQTPNVDALDGAYRDLVVRKADIIIASGGEGPLKAALAAAPALPIVMIAADFDPFERGYVTSLARPGGNVTGVFLQQIELAAKRLQLFKDALPGMTAAATFWDRTSADQWKAAQEAGAKLQVRLAGIDVGNPPLDFERLLSQSPPEHRSNLFVLASPVFLPERARLADFALSKGVRTNFAFREYTAAGGLMSYGPSLTGMFRLTADYVDRIAKGAKPADLPIEQPTRFEFVVNLKTATSLGLTLPTSTLLRADEVIE